MPRKRKPPVQMVVQGMTTWVTLSPAEYCEFTGKVIKPEVQTAPATMDKRKPPKLSERKQREKQAELEFAQQHSMRTRMAYEAIRATTNPDLPELAPLPRELEPSYNQVHTKSKLVITVHGPAKPWRRL
jgi:hypothetical protein